MASWAVSRRAECTSDRRVMEWAGGAEAGSPAGRAGTAAHAAVGQGAGPPPPRAHVARVVCGATLFAMLRLVETFFRHRMLLLAPMALVAIASLGWVVTQPPSYDASVRIWTQRQTLVPDPNGNPYLSPAQEQAAVLTELISTKYFCAKVGKRTPLAGVARFHLEHASGGTRQKLLSLVGLGSSRGPVTDSQVDDLVFTTISASTLILPSGPEIIAITYRDTDPQMAATIAQAIADQFIDETLSNQRVQADAALTFYTGQLQQARSDTATADKAMDDYIAANTAQRSANASPDARLSQLKHDDDAAHARLASVQDKLDQARLDRAALNQPGVDGIRVLDRAEPPSRASSTRKTIFTAVGVTVALVLLILVVGVLALTWVDSTIRRPEEVETVLDLRPVGSVPRVS